MKKYGKTKEEAKTESLPKEKPQRSQETIAGQERSRSPHTDNSCDHRDN
jgi:hypothetical protein